MDLIRSMVDDGVTGPEAVVILGLLTFAGFVIVAFFAFLIFLLSDR